MHKRSCARDSMQHVGKARPTRGCASTNVPFFITIAEVMHHLVVHAPKWLVSLPEWEWLMSWNNSAPFWDLVTTWRQRRQLTQTALASALGVHRSTIGRWERGEGLPETRGLVLELARVLGLEESETRQLLEASLTGLVPYWTVPFRRNPAFTGRDALLQHLQTCLAPTPPGTLNQAIALCGLGGIGKTHLAVEYAYHAALEYTAVFWLAAETAESLMTSVQQIATHLQLPERQAAEQAQIGRAH